MIVNPPEHMSDQYSKPRIIIVAMLVAGISFLHYSTKTQQVYHHIFYRELYFLPLVLAGFWFGLKGGILTSLTITALYIPEIVMDWQGFSPDDFGKILETLLFSIVAIGLGFLSDREKAAEKAMIETERIAKEQAESADRLKTDILSIMSHELRTPLISIIGYNDLLLDGVAGAMQEEQVAALKKIDRNSKRLLELINAMLDVSSFEAGNMETKDVDIDLLLAEIKEEIGADTEKKGLTVIWKAEPGLHIRTDPARLKVIIKNIIGNAVKFTEKGGVTVDLHTWNRGIEFDVTDTGIGIALEDMEIIFEPFRQVENPLTRQHGGAGLGLYMVKRLLEFLGGTITVESEVGRGSTFRVRIPAEKGAI
jgi:signal transduction histidine kinase